MIQRVNKILKTFNLLIIIIQLVTLSIACIIINNIWLFVCMFVDMAIFFCDSILLFTSVFMDVSTEIIMIFILILIDVIDSIIAIIIITLQGNSIDFFTSVFNLKWNFFIINVSVFLCGIFIVAIMFILLFNIWKSVSINIVPVDNVNDSSSIPLIKPTDRITDNNEFLVIKKDQSQSLQPQQQQQQLLSQSLQMITTVTGVEPPTNTYSNLQSDLYPNLNNK